MTLREAIPVIQQLQKDGQDVTITVSVLLDTKKTADKKTTSKKTTDKTTEKKTDKKSGSGRGRPPSEESKERAKYIRALNKQKGKTMTRVQASERVAKKFEITIDQAKNAVYAIKDLEWKSAKKGNPNIGKTSGKKKKEAEEEFNANLDDDDDDDDDDAETDDDDDDDDDAETDDDDNDDDDDDEDSEEIDLDEFEIE